MTPDQIHAILLERRKRLVDAARAQPEGRAYFLDEIKRGTRSTRVLRVSAHPSNPHASRLKLSASSRSNPNREVVIDFAEDETALLRIVDREIDRLESRMQSNLAATDGTRLSGSAPKVTDKPSSDCSEAPIGPSPSELAFDLVDPGIDRTGPLLYMWEVTDDRGSIIGVYVGKAANAKRPLRRYKRVVALLLANKRYSFRRIHNALGAACRDGHRVTLTLVCNVPAGENIFFWESALILAMDAHGLEKHQLNGTSGESARGLPLPSGLADALAVLAQQPDRELARVQTVTPGFGRLA